LNKAVITFDESKIEKGNTHKGVNKAIIKFLSYEVQNGFKLNRIFDCPCGEGEFLRSMKFTFPDLEFEGQDLYSTPNSEVEPYFFKGNASYDLKEIAGDSFCVSTSISGVPAFDEVSQHLEQLSRITKPSGYVICTNDNIMTIRDRMHFLFFGHVKRFKLFYSKNEGIWNQMCPQAIWMILEKNNMSIKKVIYVNTQLEDLCLLPLAIALYPINFLYMAICKSHLTLKQKYMLFPFSMLLSRHYIFIAEKQEFRRTKV
jgi:ubiquinone/menaquinone biosynthesis C-methylase UbiE